MPIVIKVKEKDLTGGDDKYKIVPYPNSPPHSGPWRYDSIYKSSMKEKPIVWWVGFDGIDRIIVEHGQVGGQMIRSTHQIELNTSGRNMYEQSTLQIKERYHKKRQSGYRSPSEPRGNMDKGPMLANKFQDRKKIEYPLMAQPKIDGVRCTARPSTDLSDGIGVKFYSRLNNEFPLLHDIKQSISDFLAYLPAGAILDGELYSPKIPSQAILGMVKATKNPDPRLSQVKLYIYDLILFDNEYLENSYIQRYQMLVEAYKNYLNNERKNYESELQDYFIKDIYSTIVDYIREPQTWCLVASNKVNSKIEVEEAHQKYVEMGYEGVMLRVMENSPYKFGRTSLLLKYKHFLDAEAKVIGYEESSGEWEGTPIFILQDKQGRTFKATPKGDRPSRRQMFLDIDQYIGKMMNYRYQEVTDMGIPRFPIAMGLRGKE
ncbi:MAG: ATP-dependent DNA ligase [Solumvirus sp.]|uniref:DNA ligase n=1 Tax=Solumvirus sp. TaxID=2487773 RepID=A0A3G5AGC3_9VIRU|nr:MAG: ATP-dependent DNA ligase [Solumvirus sp.]